MTSSFRILRPLLFLGGVGLLLFTPFIGSTYISWSDVLNPDSVAHRIFFELRIPRLLVAFAAGGSLAILGATYQILFHNPLAEPYILGVSNAVILGVVVSFVFLGAAPGTPWGNLAGALGGLIIILLMIRLYKTRWGEPPHRLVLFGMGIQFVLSSILFMLLSYHEQSMGGGSMRWLFGQMPWVSMKEAVVFCVSCLFFFSFMLVWARPLDALGLGDSVCKTLGYSPQLLRNVFLIMTSVFVAVIVSVTGAIGFVGLVIPHATRLCFRPTSTRQLYLQSFFVGGVFLVVADIFSRILFPPFEFPVGIITTLIGGPLFLYLLWRR